MIAESLSRWTLIAAAAGEANVVKPPSGLQEAAQPHLCFAWLSRRKALTSSFVVGRDGFEPP